MGQKIARIILVALFLLVLMPVNKALADTTSDPHAHISIVSSAGFRSLAEDGDMTLIVHWQWSGNVSATPASTAVTVSMSYNGTTLAQTTPYVFSLFENNGYGDGVSSFYFSANSSPVYQGDYTIRIAGNPSVFAGYNPFPLFDYLIPVASYETGTTQAANRLAAKTYILNECDSLETVYPDVALKSTSDIGNVLTEYGETYWTSVIPNLQSLVPAIFFVQTAIPETIAVQAYDSSLQATYTAQIVGTDLKRGADRIGAKFGVTGYFVWGLIIFGLCLFIIIKTSQKGWALEPAIFVCICVMTAAALAFGSLFFTLVMVISLLAIIGISWVLFGKRA